MLMTLDQYFSLSSNTRLSGTFAEDDEILTAVDGEDDLASLSTVGLSEAFGPSDDEFKAMMRRAREREAYRRARRAAARRKRCIAVQH